MDRLIDYNSLTNSIRAGSQHSVDRLIDYNSLTNSIREGSQYSMDWLTDYNSLTNSIGQAHSTVWTGSLITIVLQTV